MIRRGVSFLVTSSPPYDPFKKQVRSWEKRDIVDVLKDHHTDLIKASKELANGGDNEGSNEIDNDVIVIENYLETEHGLVWDGIEFLK